MLLNDLTETRKTIPFAKGGLRNARGGYAAFVCVMDPKDFVRLATSDEAEYQQIFDQTKVDLDAFSSGQNELSAEWYIHPPFLDVEYETGRVKGHEGRHRAAMVAKAGGDKYTCVISFKARNEYVVTYVAHRGDVVLGKFSETFYTVDDAENRVNFLKSYGGERHRLAELGIPEVVDFDHSIDMVEMKTYRGGVMKGSPDSDFDNWEYAEWKNEHFPPQLVGQYDTSVVVPTSSMRFGPIKGYRHHLRSQ